MSPADRRRRWLAAGLVIASGLSSGCRSRAPQVEFANLRHSAALRTAANTRSRERLERAAAAIDADRASGRVGPEEYAAYAAIIALARAGDWPAAERAAVRFRLDQTRPGSRPKPVSLPPEHPPETGP